MSPRGARGGCPSLLQLTLLNLILLHAVDAVIPRHYRYQQDRRRQDMLERAKLLNAGIVPGLAPLQPRTAIRPPVQVTAPQKYSTFRPSVARCCKIGEKTARKGKVCDLDLLGIKMAVSATQEVGTGRKWGESYQMRNVMGEEHQRKVEQCSDSMYLSNFTKCCQYRLQFVNEMALCKKNTHGQGRRQCRQEVRKRYP